MTSVKPLKIGGSRTSWSPESITSSVAGLSAPVFICLFQFGGIHYYFWGHYNKVNRQDCSCTCWDTGFKGIYEVSGHRYHHMYFNLTWQMFFIAVVSIVAVILSYEGSRYIFSVYRKGSLRLPALLIILCSIYAHTYAWWSYVNYLNDDFYSQWMHQTLFTVTEFIATLSAFRLLDSSRDIPLSNSSFVSSVMIIFTISLFHVVAGSLDQFIANALGEGESHQVFRDLALALPDILSLFCSWILLNSRLEEEPTLVRHKQLQRKSLSWYFTSPLLLISNLSWCSSMFGAAFLTCLSRLL